MYVYTQYMCCIHATSGCCCKAFVTLMIKHNTVYVGEGSYYLIFLTVYV